MRRADLHGARQQPAAPRRAGCAIVASDVRIGCAPKLTAVKRAHAARWSLDPA